MNNNKQYGLAIMLSEMPNPRLQEDQCIVISSQASAPRNAQRSAGNVNLFQQDQYKDFPELGCC